MKHWPWQHKYTVKPVGEYSSITGPRTIFFARCACGKSYNFTRLGYMSYYRENTL